MSNYGLHFNAPKNFKNGRLIGNRYRVGDLVLLISCGIISALSLIIYISVMHGRDLFLVVMMFVPAALAYVLTLPSGGVYHNNMELLKMLLYYNRSKHSYQWEGIYKYDEK